MEKDDKVLFQSRLVMAEILYNMPDYPSLLQSFVWQTEDIPPIYPKLKHFLQFWHAELEGNIYMVRIDKKELFEPSSFRNLDFDGFLQ